MTVSVLYIDDDDKELKKYDQRFKDDPRMRNRFKLISRNTPKNVGDYDHLIKIRPELILVDFDLSKPDKDRKVIGISGITLSTEIRQKFQEVPIVLFTRKSVFRVQNYLNIKQTLLSLDDIIYKHDLFEPNSRLPNILYELAIGFKRLRDSKAKRWLDLLRIIKAPKSDHDKLKLADPPIYPETNSSWSASKAAKWIHDTLIEYPGILYDPIHAGTLLGISEKAFLRKDIQDFFAKAKYSGIFSPPEGRWWKSGLVELANSKMNESESSLVIREGFSVLWKRVMKGAIEKSKCVFSGESPAEWVCYILKKPMMIKYSLFYKPDSRPSVMDEARVSFEAIRISNEVNDSLFDPIGQELLPKIKKIKKGSVK